MSFAHGQSVRVKDVWPEARGRAHIRTPHYVRGEIGTIIRHLGDYPNPEDVAFDRPAPLRALYHVSFPLKQLWADAKGGDLLVEIYEHWLEAA